MEVDSDSAPLMMHDPLGPLTVPLVAPEQPLAENDVDFDEMEARLKQLSEFVCRLSFPFDLPPSRLSVHLLSARAFKLTQTMPLFRLSQLQTSRTASPASPSPSTADPDDLDSSARSVPADVSTLSNGIILPPQSSGWTLVAEEEWGRGKPIGWLLGE
jgi:hypothetical protein